MSVVRKMAPRVRQASATDSGADVACSSTYMVSAPQRWPTSASAAAIVAEKASTSQRRSKRARRAPARYGSTPLQRDDATPVIVVRDQDDLHELIVTTIVREVNSQLTRFFRVSSVTFSSARPRVALVQWHPYVVFLDELTPGNSSIETFYEFDGSLLADSFEGVREFSDTLFEAVEPTPDGRERQRILWSAARLHFTPGTATGTLDAQLTSAIAALATSQRGLYLVRNEAAAPRKQPDPSTSILAFNAAAATKEF